MWWLIPAFLACSHPASTPGPQPVTVMDEAGFQGLLGSDEPIVVNLFATWCSACRGEMGEFRAFQDQDPGMDLALVSLDRQGSTPEVQAWVDRYGPGMPVFHLSVEDPIATVARHLPVFHGGIPVTAVVAEGRVLAHRSGRVDTGDLAALLQEARTGYTGAP